MATPAAPRAYLWVAGKDYIPWQQTNDRSFELVTDKKSYTPGDTAQILIASPFQGEAYALVTVERGHIRYQEVLLLTNNSTIYKLPITPDLAPNAYISVLVVKGVDETNPRPNFKMGIAEIKVDTGQQTLQRRADRPTGQRRSWRAGAATPSARSMHQGQPVQRRGLAQPERPGDALAAAAQLAPNPGFLLLQAHPGRLDLGAHGAQHRRIQRQDPGRYRPRHGEWQAAAAVKARATWAWSKSARISPIPPSGMRTCVTDAGWRGHRDRHPAG